MLLPQSISKSFSTKNSQSGQIVIIFLLILVVGLAIVLSVASRTVTDIRQSTTSDDSNRAYFAAEAGIQKALKQLTDDPSFTTSSQLLDFSGVNNSQSNIVVSSLQVAAGQVFEFPGKIAQNDTVQVYLMSDFSNISTAGGSVVNSDTLNFYWDDPSSSGSGPALEVSILSCTLKAGAGACDNSNIDGNNNFQIAKMTFDPDSSRASANNFCNTVSTNPPAVINNSGVGSTFRYKASVTLNAVPCKNNDNLASGRPILARIHVLYTGPVRIGVENSGKGLPNQGQLISSTGKTTSGVTRKLTVTKLYPSLPAIFDYVLYNGSASCPLTKNTPPPC